jgi:peptidoglycan biosynthesis protein MviN/MurJ (putative lipid II flippase)
METILLAGLAGGIIRGLVGYLKYRSSYKNTKFVFNYFVLSVIISGLVGLIAAWITKDLGITFLGLDSLTPALAIVIGYAGGDFIENLFKIITGKTSLYELPAEIIINK